MKYSEKTMKRIENILDSAKDQKAGDFSPIVEKAIVAAASDRASHELNQKAWLLVYNGLLPFIYKNVRQYAYNGNQEDYMNDFMIVIIQHLSEWRPHNGKLTTFFAKKLLKSCNESKLKEQTFSSMYYKNVYWDIEKAKNELIAENDGKAPTDKEIYASLKEKGLNHSLRSIKETMNQNVHIVSLDAPNEEDNCLLDTLTSTTENDIKTEATWKTIEKMSPTHKVILEAEYEFFSNEKNQKRKKMKISELHEKVKPKFGDVSISWLREQRQTAERIFAQKYQLNYYYIINAS